MKKFFLLHNLLFFLCTSATYINAEKSLSIALAQIEVVPQQPNKNVSKMLSFIEKAKIAGADIIIFPEMCVGGYCLSDYWLVDSHCTYLMEFNEQLRKASNDIVIIHGNIFLDATENAVNKDGRKRRFNAAYVFYQGKGIKKRYETGLIPCGIQPKTLLPNYRIFDDVRYFFSLNDIAQEHGIDIEQLLQPFTVTIKGKTINIGVELCEDLWCSDYRYKNNSFNITKMLIENGADIIVNLSASPWTYLKNQARDKRINFLKKELGNSFVPFFYVNCVGAQNNGKNIITFDGGSTIYNNDGNPIAYSKKPYQEDLLIVPVMLEDAKEVIREEKSKIAQKFDAIICGLKHIKNILGKEQEPSFVLGLSGGIDSAVVLALLTLAAGNDKVTTINMPTHYNSEKTKLIAQTIANNLGVQLITIPIQELSTLNKTMLEAVDTKNPQHYLLDLNNENIMAKIRGTCILSNYAQRHGCILTNNGNKLEIALGYATLYGDVNGAIAPIGDLTKTEVFAMARYLNEEIFKKEVIPNDLIPNELCQFSEDQMPPSAELRNNQIDPMKFGYHDALLEAITDYQKKSIEDFVEWYLEGTLAEHLHISPELLARWGLGNPEEFIKDLEWFDRLVHLNVFKRIQAPPIIMTSKSSYGYDIRESQLPYTQTTRYRELKNALLQN